ncbi:hypothetical protein WMY93_032232 [Mugilogobius chulae]|uniref:Uncharacterized protein n=1 Tax=Mugilogobius chulae TaxID=88201 RepID=A0AAW0MG72_9GOBI
MDLQEGQCSGQDRRRIRCIVQQATDSGEKEEVLLQAGQSPLSLARRQMGTQLGTHVLVPRRVVVTKWAASIFHLHAGKTMLPGTERCQFALRHEKSDIIYVNERSLTAETCAFILDVLDLGSPVIQDTSSKRSGRDRFLNYEEHSSAFTTGQSPYVLAPELDRTNEDAADKNPDPLSRDMCGICSVKCRHTPREPIQFLRWFGGVRLAKPSGCVLTVRSFSQYDSSCVQRDLLVNPADERPNCTRHKTQPASIGYFIYYASLRFSLMAICLHTAR